MLDRLRTLLREPLVLFLALGALLFAADALLNGDGAGDRTIVVPAGQVVAFRADFAQRNGRAPSEAEIRSFLDNWVEREVLYREARALGLDRNDRLIRRQLVRKMRYLIEDADPQPEPTDAELAAWLEAHPERYGRGPTVSFDHVFIDRAHRDGEAHAASLLARLRQGKATADTAGDAFPGGAAVDAADPEELTRRFGSGFRAQLEGLDEDRWHGPLRSRLGLHLVRITDRTPFQPADLESAGRKLRVEYRSHRREQANARAVERLRARYDVRVQEPAE